MSKKKTRLKFSLSLVAVIALMAAVIGVVAGRTSSDSAASTGGGNGGAAAGKKVDVIIKASDSSFWQTMLAGARKAGGDYGLKVGLFGPTSETDVNEQVQLVENSISRGADAIVLAPNSSNALNSAIKRARSAGIKIVLADTAVTTPAEGFIGTDNVKAGQQAGERMCQLVKQQGNELRRGDDRVLGRRHPDAEGPRQRLPPGTRRRVPAGQGRLAAVQQQRHQHRGQPGQRRR